MFNYTAVLSVTTRGQHYLGYSNLTAKYGLAADEIMRFVTSPQGCHFGIYTKRKF